MTVGHEVARRTGLRLLHNHHTIDLVLRFFDYGTPAFGRLVADFRRRILEEVAASDLPGVVFTFVWAFDHASDRAAVDAWAEIFRRRGGRVLFVELEAEQRERLRRNETEFRLSEKPFKRDLAASREQLLAIDAKYVTNSGGRFDDRADWLRLETTTMSAEDAAERILVRFGLPRSAGGLTSG